MTQVTLKKASTTGEFISCTAVGHSGYAKSGSDIVCAAISIILKVAIKTLEQYGAKLVIQSSGEGNLYFCIEDKNSIKCLQLVCMADIIENGMRSLSKDYSAYVNFTIDLT